MPNKQRGHGGRVTLGDIAADVDLSAAAVSMALRGNSRVSAETQKRVTEAAERLGYVYDRGAAKLRTGQSDTIGIIVGDISNAFFGELVAGVDAAIAPAGKISFLLNAREDVDRQSQLLNRLREHGVDGIILCPAPETDEATIEEIRHWGIPIVQMLRTVADTSGDWVSADYKTGVEALCEHLVRRGHRRIALIGGELEHSATWQRHTGYRAALKRNGIEADLIYRCPLTRRAGRHAIGELLTSETPPTAAVCYNDVVAFGVIAGLRENGIEPGKDFAVTGFDNVEEAAESWPPLTTVATHAREIGDAAGQLLLRRINEPDASREQIIVPTRLIVRQSCGAAAETPQTKHNQKLENAAPRSA
ncbi:MAG: LacI family DNA-binding transcriptional regulator [Pseudomonadota bacterium]